ncbi:MAG: hypothetical protein IE922_01640 [Sphingomonadales bacterium]|nr:hypothetical protein [Sphingomonadales bacterium]
MIDPDPVLTADDIIRGGACISGTHARLLRLRSKVAAAMPASTIKEMIPENEHAYVDRAAGLDGYGYGYGYGYGDGDGDGDGDGYGDGDGDGDGYGDGYGYGSQ